MEGDLNEMELQLSQANRHAAESQKLLRNLQVQIKVRLFGGQTRYLDGSEPGCSYVKVMICNDPSVYGILRREEVSPVHILNLAHTRLKHKH
jgi:hypothetical protein